MTLSDQALGAVMMALQKSLLEQTDIVPVLKGFNFNVSETEELVVTNPPIVKATEGMLLLDPEEEQNAPVDDSASE